MFNNTPGAVSCSKQTADPADVYGGAIFDPTTSTNLPLSSQISSRQLNLAAVWEPDADGDGFGDVSQDLCPQLATTAGACPTPDTKVKKPKLVGPRKVKFTFTSTIPGSTFRCAIDSNNFVPCANPLKKKFSFGKHVILVAAVSPAGIVDPTPFKGKFKLVRR